MWRAPSGNDAQRDRTHILIASLTIIFVLVVVSLEPFAIYPGNRSRSTTLIALLVCLIPTTIGGLLSAIGIAGMDRMVQRNVLAMSGRAVEAAGDVDVCSWTRLAPSRWATARRHALCRME